MALAVQLKKGAAPVVDHQQVIYLLVVLQKPVVLMGRFHIDKYNSRDEHNGHCHQDELIPLQFLSYGFHRSLLAFLSAIFSVNPILHRQKGNDKKNYLAFSQADKASSKFQS